MRSADPEAGVTPVPNRPQMGSHAEASTLALKADRALLRLLVRALRTADVERVADALIDRFEKLGRHHRA